MRISFCISILVFSACQHDMSREIFLSEYPSNPFLELLWQHPLPVDASLQPSCLPLIHGSKAAMLYMDKDSGFCIQMRHALSGTLRWAQNEAGPPDFKKTHWQDLFSDKYLFIPGFAEGKFIDINTGAQIWNVQAAAFGECNFTGMAAMIGDQTYLSTHCYESGFRRSIWRLSPDKHGRELLYTDTGIDGFAADFMDPVLYKNSIGDSLLIFPERSLDSDPSYWGLMAFDLTKRTVAWRKEIPVGQSLHVYRDKIYFMGQYALCCLSAENGALIWSKDYKDQVISKPEALPSILVDKGILVCHPGIAGIEALDPGSGKLIWSGSNPGANCRGLSIYDNYILYVSGAGGLFIHDLSDGRLLGLLHAPAQAARDFNTPIAVDQASGRLYAGDGCSWYCYRIKS